MSDLPKTLHPMTVRDILDRSVQLYKNNVAKFIGIILLIKGPYLVITYILTDSILTIRLVETLFIGPILVAVMTVAVSEHFLDKDIGIAEVYSRILQKLFPLLGTVLLTGLATAFGFLMFVIPGFLMWTWFAFIPQAVALEDEGGISAIKRSKYLIKGYFIRAFALLILIFIAVSLVTEIIALGVDKTLYPLGDYSALLADGVSNVISIILEPFRIAVTILLYYDLRIRKEGFDLEIMAAELAANMDDDYSA